MSDREWSRSPAWDDDAKRDFEERLGRARPWNRPQYLRGKGLALLTSGNPDLGPEGCLLLERIVDEYPDSYFDVEVAHQELGRAYLREGRLEEAAAHLRASIEVASRSGDDGGVSNAIRRFDLIDALLQQGRLDEATDTWAETEGDDRLAPYLEIMPMVAYGYFLTKARLQDAQGEEVGARTAALAALEHAAATRSGLRNHPRDTLVPSEDPGLPYLHELAKGADQPSFRRSRQR